MAYKKLFKYSWTVQCVFRFNFERISLAFGSISSTYFLCGKASLRDLYEKSILGHIRYLYSVHPNFLGNLRLRNGLLFGTGSDEPKLVYMNKYLASVFTFVVFVLIFTITKAQVPSPDPIIIIPGIGASWNWNIMLDPTPTPQLDDWDFLLGVKQYDQLIQALEDKGLVQDEDYLVAFYDWRQSSSDSAEDYLIPVIDQALAHSESGKVDIIAHSMGGLVARPYLQSDEYRGDVDQFIMLGTPNYGSSDVYTLWEGGLIPDNWDKAQRAVLSGYIWYSTKVTALTSDSYDTIHQVVPAVKEMLPTYDFLHDKSTDTPIAATDMQERNLFLEVLNLPTNLITLAINTGDVHVIAGEGEQTVGTIPVVPHTDADGKLWVDGKPDPLSPERDSAAGDNRVLISSAFFDIGSPPSESYEPSVLWKRLVDFFIPRVYAQGIFLPFSQQSISSKHGDLPTTSIPQIFDILELGPPVTAYAPLPEPEEALSFWIASPVDVEIKSPSGGTISKNEITVPGAFFDAEDDPRGVKLIFIENPEEGRYTIELTGLANGTYHVGVGAFSNLNDDVQTVIDEIQENQQVGYHVAYDPENAETPTEISAPFPLEEEKTPTELLDELTASLTSYFNAGEIKNRGAYKSLLATLKTAEFFLNSNRTKLTLVSLNVFKKLVAGYQKAGRERIITNAAAADFLAQAQVIIDALKE